MGGPPGAWQAQLAEGPYPVRVDFDIPPHNSRFFAIPLLGFLARYVMVIPHLIVLSLVGILVYLSQVVLWLIVLLTGHYPRWGYALVGGYIRWATRLLSFMFGLTDRYPPFRLKN